METVKRLSKTKLKEARKLKKLSLVEASRRLKVEGRKISKSTLSNFENQDLPNVPTADDLPAICKVYNKTMNYLYKNEDDNVKK